MSNSPKKRNRDPENYLMQRRDKMLLANYARIIKKHGFNATNISCKQKYEEAAQPFSISIVRARQIINKMLKEKQLSNNLSIEECDELLYSLDSLNSFTDIKCRIKTMLNELGIEQTENTEKIIRKYFPDGQQ